MLKNHSYQEIQTMVKMKLYLEFFMVFALSEQELLYIVYLPSMGALYDKVDQCAIFNRPNTPDKIIKMNDVAWWDTLSDYWQLTQIQGHYKHGC